MSGAHRVNGAQLNERSAPPASNPPSGGPKTIAVEGWTLHEYETADSTNFAAARLPAWSAVRADVQTGGRGRFQRSWVSDRGGLWLSAVIPTGPDPREWEPLPLAAGLAVCDALASIGVENQRMRWPNDVLVNDRKLVGILIDQFAPGLAVVGIGVNVNNNPENHDGALKNRAARLADVLSQPPPLNLLAAMILASLRVVVEEMRRADFKALLPRIDKLWGPPRRVELDLDGRLLSGEFSGVDSAGRLILQDGFGGQTAYDARQVKHLSELPEGRDSSFDKVISIRGRDGSPSRPRSPAEATLPKPNLRPSRLT